MNVADLFGLMLLGVLVVSAAVAAWIGLRWLAMRAGLRAPDFPPEFRDKP